MVEKYLSSLQPTIQILKESIGKMVEAGLPERSQEIFQKVQSGDQAGSLKDRVERIVSAFREACEEKSKLQAALEAEKMEQKNMVASI